MTEQGQEQGAAPVAAGSAEPLHRTGPVGAGAGRKGARYPSTAALAPSTGNPHTHTRPHTHAPPRHDTWQASASLTNDGRIAGRSRYFSCRAGGLYTGGQ